MPKFLKGSNAKTLAPGLVGMATGGFMLINSSGSSIMGYVLAGIGALLFFGGLYLERRYENKRDKEVNQNTDD